MSSLPPSPKFPTILPHNCPPILEGFSLWLLLSPAAYSLYGRRQINKLLVWFLLNEPRIFTAASINSAGPRKSKKYIQRKKERERVRETGFVYWNVVLFRQQFPLLTLLVMLMSAEPSPDFGSFVGKVGGAWSWAAGAWGPNIERVLGWEGVPYELLLTRGHPSSQPVDIPFDIIDTRVKPRKRWRRAPKKIQGKCWEKLVLKICIH